MTRTAKKLVVALLKDLKEALNITTKVIKLGGYADWDSDLSDYVSRRM